MFKFQHNRGLTPGVFQMIILEIKPEQSCVSLVFFFFFFGPTRAMLTFPGHGTHATAVTMSDP